MEPALPLDSLARGKSRGAETVSDSVHPREMGVTRNEAQVAGLCSESERQHGPTFLFAFSSILAVRHKLLIAHYRNYGCDWRTGG